MHTAREKIGRTRDVVTLAWLHPYWYHWSSGAAPVECWNGRIQAVQFSFLLKRGNNYFSFFQEMSQQKTTILTLLISLSICVFSQETERRNKAQEPKQKGRIQVSWKTQVKHLLFYLRISSVASLYMTRTWASVFPMFSLGDLEQCEVLCVPVDFSLQFIFYGHALQLIWSHEQQSPICQAHTSVTEQNHCKS